MAAVAGIGGLVAGLLPLLLAPYLLTRRDPLASTDAIVVLGGFPAPRSALAASLYHDRIAPLILVSGTGDCGEVADSLVRLGVPRERLIIECDSISTLENAQLSGAILHDRGIKRIVLATSWWHSSRARAVFAKIVPGIEIIMYPTRASGWPPVGSLDEAFRIYLEYPKWAWYCAEYDICP
ncbi:MAG: YdcF family protein [Alphaproteobacteria bacterium]|nr:YdcF family protein [Alphaproteobacteria bacterium]